MSASLKWLASWNMTLSVKCRHGYCRHTDGLMITAKDAMTRWGADQTLADIKARFKCVNCDERGRAIIDVTGGPSYPTGYGDDLAERMALYEAFGRREDGPY